MATNIKNSLTTKQTTELQKALQSLGYNVGKTGADGIIGKNTQAAIDSAYKNLGLKTWQGGGISQLGYDKIIAASNKKPTITQAPTSTNSESYVPLAYTNPSYNSMESYNAAKADAGQAWEAYKNFVMPPTSPRYDDNSINEFWGKGSLGEAAVNRLGEQKAENIKSLEDLYAQEQLKAGKLADESARQHYITHRQSREKLPELLEQRGITGGASETANVNLLNSYSSNLALNEKARQEALAALAGKHQSGLSDVENAYINNLLEAERYYSGKEFEADAARRREQDAIIERQMALAEAMRNQLLSEAQMKQQRLYDVEDLNAKTARDDYLIAQELSLQNKAEAEQKANKAAVDAWNRNVAEKASKAKYTFVDNDGKVHYANSERKINELHVIYGGGKINSSASGGTGSGTSSGTSSGGGINIEGVWGTGGGTGSTGTSSGKTATSVSYNTALQNAMVIAKNGALQGPAQNIQGGVKYVENLLNSGKISEQYANGIINELFATQNNNLNIPKPSTLK